MNNVSRNQTLKELISVSSRMLRLKSVEELCELTAKSVVQFTVFKRCVVSILEVDGGFARIGFGGLDEEQVEQLKTMPRSTLDSMEEMLVEKFRISRSYYLPHSEVEMTGLESHKEVKNGESWHPDDFLFIPLYDPDGSIVGLISVDDPEDGLKPTEDLLLPMELFASQIAAALENLRNHEKQQAMIEQLRQQQEVVLELSTPVIRIWDQVLVLPLIGSVDSARAQQIMENVLLKISETNSSVVIIDITGVPVIDTMVASNLLKTVSAARLLGARTIITGINPEVAQTLIHLGVNLADISTQSNLAKGIQQALKFTGKQIMDNPAGE